MSTKKITLAFCTYNRAERLEKLVEAIRRQTTSTPFDILAVNNNSTDHTLTELERLAKLSGPVLRYVTETEQGIVAARNRAIAECLDSGVMIFIDDDEIPLPGLIESAAHSILQQGAECVGGKVALDFSTHARPHWLKDELLGFLAEVDYGNEPFWIKDTSTPIWTANIAYDMRMFRENSELRFDKRYDRKGKVIGGGSDAAMFATLLKQGSRIYYNPGMCVLHDVEPWRLHRSYFLKLHYRSGMRKAYNELPNYPRTLFGIPPFMIKQLLKHSLKTVWMYLTCNPGKLRQTMNASYALGLIAGYRLKNKIPHQS
ncbi:glycosyltransferase [Methylomicrobium sp. RS1]|uniref:glycosyltransferase n=1 Tax=Candidatus Methylomicrobium oryzae TaxID=2802053 RepID=UPI0019233CD5|nr:glycosyltransferase [Methylomicrobium sp. RS1]MBL1264987.1 glycosyltransferase family 2 protein [Methylomicrobium sp. RS1]